MDREELAASRFACGDRERAIFEAGIKMGTIYHQFVGTPVDSDTVDGLEEAMSRAVMVQPYVADARVRIDRSRIPSRGGVYSYTSLTGEMIEAVIRINVGGYTVTAEMRYDPELRYPLMYVSSVEPDRGAPERWVVYPSNLLGPTML